MEQRAIQSLLKTSAFPERTGSVYLKQTHVSLLFITDNFVYKIKKPVDFGFLNFTTLDRRRFYCNEEVVLNRRLCPDVYLDVVEVRASPHGATIDGEGTIIDYAVKMKRLPEERMLDRLLREGNVSPDDIIKIARTIADFHRNAERNSDIAGFGSLEVLQRNWLENFQQLSELAGIPVGYPELGALSSWGINFLTARRTLFDERVSKGFIRDCDGDIHTENICLTDKVCIFDCIEFNNRFRYSDTAADIAFLLMDLDFAGRPDFSSLLLSEYIAATNDGDIRGVLDYYRVYRAVVRAKVESFSMLDRQLPESDRQSAGERARRYFRLARGYALRHKLPLTLFITSGLMGSGKSTITEALAMELGIEIISSDQVRKELAGIPPRTRINDTYGSGIYSAEFTHMTYDTLLSRAAQNLVMGRSVIIDASFGRRADRDRCRALAARFAAGFFILSTSLREKVLKQRLDHRAGSPRRISDGRWELLALQKEHFEPVADDEMPNIQLDTSLPLLAVIERILERTGITWNSH
jgi:uncharacterized protein